MLGCPRVAVPRADNAQVAAVRQVLSVAWLMERIGVHHESLWKSSPKAQLLLRVTAQTREISIGPN